MYGHRLIFQNFAIVVRHADGCTSSSVIRDTNRRTACGRAMRGLVGAKIEYCKAEDEMSNDNKGYWDMPSYCAPAQRPVDWAALDLY